MITCEQMKKTMAEGVTKYLRLKAKSFGLADDPRKDTLAMYNDGSMKSRAQRRKKVPKYVWHYCQKR